MIKLIIRFCLLLLSITLLSNNLKAQQLRGNYNFLNFEKKPYYLGITLGYNSTTLKVKQSDGFAGNQRFNLVQAVASPGMNLGFITNLKVGKYFDIRFLPTLSFANPIIEFEELSESNKKNSQRYDTIILETPFHIRYKSQVYKEKRAFVIAGIKYGYDIANSSGSRDSGKLLKIATSDFAYEFGVGIQFFLPYFIFSPELKFSHGLGNVLISNGSSIVEKLQTRAITISLHIEG